MPFPQNQPHMLVPPLSAWSKRNNSITKLASLSVLGKINVNPAHLAPQRVEYYPLHHFKQHKQI